MPKSVVNPPTLVRPSGFSHGVEARGRLLFLAGQTAQDAEGRIIARGDLPGQFRQVLENLKAVVEAQGGTLQDVAKLTLYVLDKKAYQANLKAIGQIYREYFGRHYPAMTLVEVKGLWDEGALIEIDGFAVLD